MAASLTNIGRRFSRSSLASKWFPGVRAGQSMSCQLLGTRIAPFLQANWLCTPLSSDEISADPIGALSRYKDRPWDYFESEEYIERYGAKPLWADYRRNHKGGIPPQKTRKTCIRGGKISGNPCPICRDQHVFIHHQNVKLLLQFINPFTGLVLDPTRTGVCMKQQKLLNQAIQAAQDSGLLEVQVPHVDYSGEDYSNLHTVVGTTPSPPAMAKDMWYHWYNTLEPNERDLARVKKLYKPYLKV